MMNSSEIAISVKDIHKCYRLGVKEEANESIIVSLIDNLRSPIKNLKKYKSLYQFSEEELNSAEENNIENLLWALRGVSFEVARGDVLGIIGTNGAGKSTLLKVLSKITPPTTGKAIIHGRISSLLEVGTGFHQELTGRENVFLNGTILGMRTKEVEAKFDEIVDFSGVEKFLDTPVKRYSSGMRVRLAFAVAAFLEPEILIIDEVLAVGDVEFQKKCISKMQDVGSSGRTVLFVSHNMPAITRLCGRAIVLDAGRTIFDGSTPDAISVYLHAGQGKGAEKSWPDVNTAPGDDVVKLVSVKAISDSGKAKEGLDVRNRIGLEMEFVVLKEGSQLMPYYDLYNEDAIKIFSAIDQDPQWKEKKRSKGHYKSTAWIPGNLLNEGTVYVRASMRTNDRRYRPFSERDVIVFNVMDTMDGDSSRGNWGGRLEGAVRPLLDWETEYSS